MALKGLYKIKKSKDVENVSILEWKSISTVHVGLSDEKLITLHKLMINQSCSWLYEGQVVNNKPQGFGVLAKSEKSGEMVKIYAGNWADGRRNGFGGFWDDNEDYYEGNFVDGVMEGYGRIWKRDGSFYQGYWRRNVYHGEGMLILANGNRFEGTFEMGLKQGAGIFYHLKTGQIQEGYWDKNICSSSIIKNREFS